MRFESRPEGVWLLIDETASPEASVIATIRGPVEVLALKGLCEQRLQSHGLLTPFDFTFDEHDYRATPYPDRGDKVTLRIQGSDGSLFRVETEFHWPE